MDNQTVNSRETDNTIAKEKEINERQLTVHNRNIENYKLSNANPTKTGIISGALENYHYLLNMWHRCSCKNKFGRKAHCL